MKDEKRRKLEEGELVISVHGGMVRIQLFLIQ